MATFNKFNQFVEDLAKGVHNLNTGTIKVVLSNTAISATSAVLADITQIGASNGYTSGGTQATFVSGAQSSGTYKLTLNDVTFTAAGGSIATFRYVVLYNDTPTSPADPLIGWYDYGTGLTITDTNAFLVDLDQANGLLTLV